MGLFVGHLSERTGADVAAAAAEWILASRPDFRLVMIGEGPLSEALRARHSGTAVFAGWREGTALAGAYRSADVVLAPAREDMWARPVLSAWAAARAVVTSGGAARTFVLPDVNGVLVEPDAGAVAEAVGALLGDGERRGWLGRNGRAAAETAFSWDVAAGKALELYVRRDNL